MEPGVRWTFRPYRVHRQRPLMQKSLQDAKVRVGNARFLDFLIQIVAAASSAFLQTSQQCTGSECGFALTLLGVA